MRDQEEFERAAVLEAQRQQAEWEAQIGNPNFQLKAIQDEILSLITKAVNLLSLSGYNELDGELDDLRVRIRRVFERKALEAEAERG